MKLTLDLRSPLFQNPCICMTSQDRTLWPSLTLWHLKEKRYNKETSTLETCLFHHTKFISCWLSRFKNKLSRPWGLPKPLLGGQTQVITKGLSGHYGPAGWSWLLSADLILLRLSNLGSDLPPLYRLVQHPRFLAEHSYDHQIGSAHLARVLRDCTVCQLEPYQVWIHTHKLWQVLLSEINEIAFIYDTWSHIIYVFLHNTTISNYSRIILSSFVWHMDAFSSAQLQYDQKLFNVRMLLICLFHYLFQNKTFLGFVGTARRGQLFTEEYYDFKSLSASGFSSSFF